MTLARRSRYQAALDAVAARPDVRVVLLLQGDGRYLMAGAASSEEADLLSQQVALFLGAADGALPTRGREGRLRATAEMGSERVVALALGEGLVLAALLDATVPPAAQVAALDATASAIESFIAVAAPPPDRLAPKSRRILVVDDEAPIRTFLKTLLERQIRGVEVVTANDAAEALDVLVRDAPDMIITDHQMPGMTGIDLLVEARRRAPGIPTALMTGFAEVDLAVRAINETDAEIFLKKPFDIREVVAMVEQALDSHASRRDRERALDRSLAVLKERLAATSPEAGPGKEQA